MSMKNIKRDVDKLLKAIYSIVKGIGKGGKTMTKAQESLKADIEKINDESTIEKIRIFIMGILAQQKLEKSDKSSKQNN